MREYLFHSSGISAFDNRNALSSVNLIWADVVAIQVTNGLFFFLTQPQAYTNKEMSKRKTEREKQREYLDGIYLAIYLDLVALHHLLNGSAHIAQSHINPCSLHTRIRRLSTRLDQFVELGIEMNL